MRYATIMYEGKEGEENPPPLLEIGVWSHGGNIHLHGAGQGLLVEAV
jgi:hypothetical protein